VGKIFQGPDLEKIRKRMAERFSEVKLVKPDSSRAQSIEIFLAGKGFQ
jgi:23S rRNA U2552 (ribose-2'-O)-methylase RlmE/FtsJ